MLSVTSLLALLSIPGVVLSQSMGQPGYFTNFSTMPNNNSISFGRNYAVLMLDVQNYVTEPIANTTSGRIWLSCLNTWYNAVNSLNPRPLTFYSRVYFENAHYPDVKQGSPFAGYLAQGGVAVGPGSGNPNRTVQNALLGNSPLTQIWHSFVPDPNSDIVLEKTRFYAGFGNNLEHILAAQGIDTVVLSGIRSSGVIITTAINLISLNYNVFVITNTTIESPNPLGSQVAQQVDQSIKEGILPNLPAQVITLEQALAALNRSGPAVY